MKALVKAKAEPGLWMQEVPEPVCGYNDILVKTRKTALCGTDQHIFNWEAWSRKTIRVPTIIGHEFVGDVVKIGTEVNGIKVGDRVSGEGHITCGHCRNCRAGKRHLCRNTIGIGVNRDGCFAKYLTIPAGNAFLIPEGVSDDIGAILDPLGNAAHTVLSFDLVGEDVLITGAGPIGAMSAALCKHVGARYVVVTDLNDYRLNIAKNLSATRVVNVKREKLPDIQKELGMKEGFDVGLEMSGSPVAFNDILENINNGGKISFLGIPADEQMTINIHHVIFKGLIIKGIYGREMFETWYKMASMLSSGLDVSPVITHHFAVDDYMEAFETMNTGKAGKIILNWDR